MDSHGRSSSSARSLETGLKGKADYATRLGARHLGVRLAVALLGCCRRRKSHGRAVGVEEIAHEKRHAPFPVLAAQSHATTDNGPSLNAVGQVVLFISADAVPA